MKAFFNLKGEIPDIEELGMDNLSRPLEEDDAGGGDGAGDREYRPGEGKLRCGCCTTGFHVLTEEEIVGDPE